MRNWCLAAHSQLDGPIVLIGDNLNPHLASGLKEFITARDRLTVCQLPP